MNNLLKSKTEIYFQIIMIINKSHVIDLIQFTTVYKWKRIKNAI